MMMVDTAIIAAKRPHPIDIILPWSMRASS
jgi:hypothetical protein